MSRFVGCLTALNEWTDTWAREMERYQHSLDQYERWKGVRSLAQIDLSPSACEENGSNVTS